MLAPAETAPEFALSALDLRAIARRAAAPMLLALAAAAAVALAQSHIHVLADGIRRVLGVNAGWAIAAVILECASLAGYVALLSLAAGRATPRVGVRESAQITFAGAAATRLLPTAGAGGLALALWALRGAGLRSREATRTLLGFLVVLYSVFLAAIVLSGTLLALGLAGNRGPLELSAIPAAAAALAIVLCVAFAARPHDRGAVEQADRRHNAKRSPLSAASVRAGTLAWMLGGAVRDAVQLIRTCDARLAGGIAYWTFDAAVLWAMLHALGAPPAIPVVVLAYFVGQLANTLPIPGSVSGGIVGVLLAFGVAPALGLSAVLAYRTIAVWLPTPAAIAAVPALRATVARWRSGMSCSPAASAPASEAPTFAAAA